MQLEINFNMFFLFFEDHGFVLFFSSINAFGMKKIFYFHNQEGFGKRMYKINQVQHILAGL